MVKSVLVEKWESYRAELTTKFGIVSFIISTGLEGFIIVNFTDEIFSFILSQLQFVGSVQLYLGYMVFSLVTSAIYIVSLWLMLQIFRIIGLKDKKIF